MTWLITFSISFKTYKKLNEILLYDPSIIELEDAYRGMSRLASIRVKSMEPMDTLIQLEKVGFVGMHMEFPRKDITEGIIRAYKGKHGPCHYLGVQAIYSGTALAALDDDNHLFLRNIPKDICDKTHKIFELPVYRSLITCNHSGTSERKDELVDNASQLDRDASMLYEWTKDAKPLIVDRVPLFYPGPFRLLVLEDGTLIRRGNWSLVPGNKVKVLREKEGLVAMQSGISLPPIFYPQKYIEFGPGFILLDFNQKEKLHKVIETVTDFKVLRTTVPNLRKRIKEVIRNERKYFILVGNEMDDLQGCCPSEEVTEAKRLAKHGILESLAEPVQGDSCPVTLFAFKGEISMKNDSFDIQMNRAFRDRVLKELKNSPWHLSQSIIKWVLLFFVIISTVIGLWRGLPSGRSISENEIIEMFNPYEENKLQVILFHNEKRCFQCLEIEKLCRQVIDSKLLDLSKREKLVFSTMVIDDPENMGMVNHFGIFGPVVVLIQFKGDEIIYTKVLHDLSGQYRDPEIFKSALKKNIMNITGTPNE